AKVEVCVPTKAGGEEVMHGFTNRRAGATQEHRGPIPPDRLPVVEREWLALRDIAREQVYWCQHLVMIQDLHHTQSRSTLYVTDPARRCLGTKHGHESRLADPDAEDHVPLRLLVLGGGPAGGSSPWAVWSCCPPSAGPAWTRRAAGVKAG